MQVTPAGLDVGDRIVSWLDVDRMNDTDHRIVFGVFDAGELVVSGLGAVHDRFVNEARIARRRARLPSLTVATGEPRETFLAREPGDPADVHVFDDVLVIDRHSGETTPIPLALIRDVIRDGHDFVVSCRGLDDARIGNFGSATDRFVEALERARRDQRSRLADAASAFDERLAGYSIVDGWVIDPDDDPRWWSALRDVAATGERHAEFEQLQEFADRPIRLGLTTADGATPVLLGLAARGGRVAVESLSGEARATFVFGADDLDRLNAALVVTAFRRDVIALPDAELGRWAVAVRASSVVRDLRGRLVARIEHRDDWADQTRRALLG